MMSDRVTLRSETGPDGSRYLYVSRNDGGSVVLEGHDLGRSVESFWGKGHNEYEWVRTIPPSEVQKVRDALGGDSTCGVLDLIARWCAEQTPADLVATLEQHGVEMETSNWVRTDGD
jgi:hypothetical protein